MVVALSLYAVKPDFRKVRLWKKLNAKVVNTKTVRIYKFIYRNARIVKEPIDQKKIGKSIKIYMLTKI